MEMRADIVIVGAGISGLSTALGLHRLGIKSLVLESWEDLRVTGFSFTAWKNGWKALDALGIGDLLRHQRPRQQQLIFTSAISGKISSQIPLISSNKEERDYETRCLERKVLVKTMADELPKGSIRFSSKVVFIEESDHHSKLLHLADGSTIRAKVLIGCDGINSVVGRWMGLKKPCHAGRSTIRGFIKTPIKPKMMQFMGDGVKHGIAPITDNSLYWFCTFIPSRYTDKEELERNPKKMKQFTLSNLGKGSEKLREVVEKTNVDEIMCTPLEFRLPWEILLGDAITKGNMCVAGDAFHPMTPDLGQGACSSLEDGVVLARCLGRALLQGRDEDGDDDDEEYYARVKNGLKDYAKERKWRAFSLMATAYSVGFLEQGSSKALQLLRDNVLAPYNIRLSLTMAEYDCGKLI